VLWVPSLKLAVAGDVVYNGVHLALTEPGSRGRPKYVITPMGMDLVPAVMGLMQWGDRYRADPEGPPCPRDTADAARTSMPRSTANEVIMCRRPTSRASLALPFACGGPNEVSAGPSPAADEAGLAIPRISMDAASRPQRATGPGIAGTSQDRQMARVRRARRTGLQEEPLVGPRNQPGASRAGDAASQRCCVAPSSARAF
jgi:hypothetical protein